MPSIAAIAFNIGLLLASLTIITFSGNYFVDALVNYAKKIGMSAYFIGMVVVSVATSSPDIVTAIMGLIAGRQEMMSGIILGGLAIDLAFLNGWFAILAKRIKLETAVIKGIEMVVLGLMVLPYVLMLDGEISRSEGIVMVLSFIIYVLLIWDRETASGKLKAQIPLKRIWQDAAVFVLALGAMLIAGRYAVLSSISLSNMLGIPVYILSLTVLAFAAALPDGIAGTIAILKGKGGEIGFGENIGTTMMEINLFTGILAIMNPMKFPVMGVIAGLVTLMLSSIYFLIILRKGVIDWKHGCVFIALYVAFITFEITRVLWWGA